MEELHNYYAVPYLVCLKGRRTNKWKVTVARKEENCIQYYGMKA
jgi:hypothetical protein